MKIVMIYINNPPFTWETHDWKGLGGSESGFIKTAKHLALMGHDVHVFNLADVGQVTVNLGRASLTWSNIAYLKTTDQYDVALSLRHREPFDQRKVNARLKVLFLADTESHGLGSSAIDLIMSVSNWQKEKIAKEETIPDDNWYVTSNGIDAEDVDGVENEKILGRCIFTGTPERGLDRFVEIWPEIKRQVPGATLHLFSSFMGWGKTKEENDEMLHDVYARCIDPIRHLDVVNFIHVDPASLKISQRAAQLYLSPTDFYETCCMSILEAMYRGVVPVATGRAALLEKVIPNVTGALIPAYGVTTQRYQRMFIDRTVELLTDFEKWKRLSHNASLYAAQYTYETIVREWVIEWERRLK